MSNINFTDFYRETTFNPETKNQIWMSQIADSHDNWCNCDWPFAHLLASIFPVGHRDRTLTIEQILQRDLQEKCLSGGADAKNSGMAGHASADASKHIKREDQEEDLPGDELEKLLAAVEDAGTR